MSLQLYLKLCYQRDIRTKSINVKFYFVFQCFLWYLSDGIIYVNDHLADFMIITLFYFKNAFNGGHFDDWILFPCLFHHRILYGSEGISQPHWERNIYIYIYMKNVTVSYHTLRMLFLLNTFLLNLKISQRKNKNKNWNMKWNSKWSLFIV